MIMLASLLERVVGKVTLWGVGYPLCTISTRFARMVLGWHIQGGKKHAMWSGGKQMKVSLHGSIVGNVDIA